MHNMIFTGFSPNITTDNVRRACAFLFFPWKWLSWKRGSYRKGVEEALRNYFSVTHALTVDSGRSALFLSLQALGIKPGDEVLVQAYTCVVVINAIRLAGGIPVYIDIGDDFCMDPHDAKKKITSKTKTMIIQHTFGQASDMDRLMEVAKEYRLSVIEDCAHAFGTTYRGTLVGTFGDIAILSFGSDKVVSCVRGGAILTNNDRFAQYIDEKIQALPQMDIRLLLQHLLHYPFFYVGRAWYGIGIGKILLAVAKKFHMTNMIVEPCEKKGIVPSWCPVQFPNALARIVLSQIAEVDAVNEHRKKIAFLYAERLRENTAVLLPPVDEECIYLRYTIRVEEASRIRAYMIKKGIMLGDWYDTVIAPKDIDMTQTGYLSGSCPRAEHMAAVSLNLPTSRHITKEDATFIIDTLSACLALPSNK